MLFVQHNLLAENANRQLNLNTKKNTKITEKLSSGYKINRAADDAAGLAISEKMRRQIRGLHQGAENINDGIGYVQTAEGALNEVHDMLQRINELAVKAASETNTDVDREYIDSEIQALKKEMDRIFDTTTFNEHKIWDYGPGEDELDYYTEDAVKYIGGASYITETDANWGILPDFEYEVEANDKGIIVKWMGCSGKEYTTDLIEWDDVEVNGNTYSFKMEDYISNPNLLDKDGKALLNKTVSFIVHEAATRADIIKSINGAHMSSFLFAPMSVHDDDCKNISGTLNANGVVIKSSGLNYSAAYASHAAGSYTLDGANDSFIVPSPASGNLTVPATKSDKWVFTFIMPGIGTVSASSDVTFYHDGTQYTYNDTGGNLGSVENAITSAINTLKGTAALGGSSKGYVSVNFKLTADKAYTYGDGRTSTDVGQFSIDISLSADDTPEQVFRRVEKALNSDTILDFYKETTNNTAVVFNLIGNNVKIPIYPDDYVPYDDTQDFFVQAGAEAGQHISLKYEFLSVNKLGMSDTNVLSTESAGNAINEVKQALKKISEQRSLFGAYQNRLEHAYNINENVVENTQSAEALIRDIDIADAMMEYSINNILMQTGISMLTQANQNGQSILELLQ